MAKPRRVLWRLAGALAYLVVVLAFFEGSARLALSRPDFLRRVAGWDDASWRLQWIRSQHDPAGPQYHFDVPHPTRGWALRGGIRDLPVFGDRLLSSSSEGARGRREYRRPKAPGVQRILVFGDSYTFGEDVGDEETYAHFLEQLLPNTEVVNLGVHGYGHDQMLLYLREVGARYEPDVVLLGFVVLDSERNLLGFRDFAKPRFERVGGRLELRGTPVPTPEEVLAGEWQRSRFADLLTMLHWTWLWRTGRARDRMDALTASILDEFQREARRLGAQPVFVHLPIAPELLDPRRDTTRGERFLLRCCRQSEVPCLRLRPKMQPLAEEVRPLGVVRHWTALEHRVAAEGIRDFLVENGLVRRSDPGGARSRPAHRRAG